MDMDVLISTNDGFLDMKTGLDTMQGISNSVRTVVESVLTKEVPKRKTAKDKIRTQLKRNFKGSYGQIFSVNVFDDGLNSIFSSVSEESWGEIIQFFLADALYKETGDISEEAVELIDELGDKYNQVVEQIRNSCLKDIHQVSMRFNESVALRMRLKDQQLPIAIFDKETAEILKPIRSRDVTKLSVIVTRLNIHTGNGRLQIKGDDETVAFGFGIKYKDVVLSAKKIFSENLDKNNGASKKDWIYIKVVVESVKLKSGKIIKYIIKSYEA